MRRCKWKKRERVGDIDIDRGWETQREKTRGRENVTGREGDRNIKQIDKQDVRQIDTNTPINIIRKRILSLCFSLFLHLFLSLCLPAFLYFYPPSLSLSHSLSFFGFSLSVSNPLSISISISPTLSLLPFTSSHAPSSSPLLSPPL